MAPLTKWPHCSPRTSIPKIERPHQRHPKQPGLVLDGALLYPGGGQVSGEPDVRETDDNVSGLTNVRDGVQRPNLDGQSEQARGLAAAVAPKMQAGVISPNTMIGARKMAYGTCPPGAVCSAPDTGLAMRPKSYRHQAIPKTLLEARAMCEGQGLRLQSLDRCMARMNMLMTQQR